MTGGCWRGLQHIIGGKGTVRLMGEYKILLGNQPSLTTLSHPAQSFQRIGKWESNLPPSPTTRLLHHEKPPVLHNIYTFPTAPHTHTKNPNILATLTLNFFSPEPEATFFCFSLKGVREGEKGSREGEEGSREGSVEETELGWAGVREWIDGEKGRRPWQEGGWRGGQRAYCMDGDRGVTGHKPNSCRRKGRTTRAKNNDGLRDRGVPAPQS